jgi:hypothetical protein
MQALRIWMDRIAMEVLMHVNKYINSDKNQEITQHPYTMLCNELNLSISLGPQDQVQKEKIEKNNH